MKKILPVIISLVVILFLGIWGFFIIRGRKAPPSPPVLPQEETIIEILLEERPYVSLTPRSDGKEFTMDISRIKNTQTVEYELVYLSQGLSRGVIGSLDLNGETDISRKLLLGTCSKNVCKYDEGVTEGTLTLRFRGPEGTRKFATDFHLQQGDKELNSIDGNFSLKGTFPKNTFYLTMPTVGLPGDFEEKVVAGPYDVFTSGTKTIKGGVVSLKLPEDSEGVKLYSWSGTKWIEEKGEMEDKTISADIGSLATFIVATE